jgi:hypothetical protein
VQTNAHACTLHTTYGFSPQVLRLSLVGIFWLDVPSSEVTDAINPFVKFARCCCLVLRSGRCRSFHLRLFGRLRGAHCPLSLCAHFGSRSAWPVTATAMTFVKTPHDALGKSAGPRLAQINRFTTVNSTVAHTLKFDTDVPRSLAARHGAPRHRRHIANAHGSWHPRQIDAHGGQCLYGYAVQTSACTTAFCRFTLARDVPLAWRLSQRAPVHL